MSENNPPWDCMFLDLSEADDDDIWYDCTHPECDRCDSCNAWNCRLYVKKDD